MADTTTTTTEPTTDPDGKAQEETQKETDWESKYRDAIAHSREWEKRAKENKAAADELAKLKEDNLSETEKLTRRAEKAEKALADYKAAEQANQWRQAAAAKHGVPESLLTATTEDAINAQAEALAGWKAQLTKPVAPKLSNPDGTPGKTGAMTSDLLHALFGRN